jgi:KaiC/GvpD/RAD55 family RecA-like ATPase
MSDAASSSTNPKVLPVIPANIPALLTGLNQWIVWKAVPKNDDKIGKIPIDPVSGRAINPHDPANHMSFEKATAIHQSGVGSGIGFDLTGDAVCHDAGCHPLYLVGLDFDDLGGNREKTEYARSVYKRLSCYREISPSGNGVRMFFLSRQKPRTGHSERCEIYTSDRFLTVTGQKGRGSINDATEAFLQIEKEFWPEAGKDRRSNVYSFPRSFFDLNRVLIGNEWAEEGQNIAKVEHALSYIPADCPYDTWRNIIWALASLEWGCGQELAEAWSSKSAKHWDDDDGEEARRAIALLFDSYKPERGITVGTLLHRAYENGLRRPERQSIALFPETLEAKPEGGVRRFKILSRDELDALPPMRWTVRGVLPETGVAAIYGEPGSGKSFLALDLAARISSGLPNWFSRQITQRDVVYAALEGGRGIKQRVAAWDAENGVRADRIKVLNESFSLLTEADVSEFTEAVAEACAPGGVVIIDTLAQATPGADENAGKDMGLVLQAAQSIARALSGLVILVHHSGKDASRGLRGHSSLNGAMDAVIAVERDRQSERRSWRVTKMKDADDGATGMFTLELHHLGDDGSGGRSSSRAVKEVSGAAAAVAAAQPGPKGIHQQAIYEALQAHPDAKKGWNYKALLEGAKTALSEVPSRHRATRAKAAIQGLIDGGLITKDELGGVHLSSISPDHPPPAPP